jgi:tetratricopeptide (TPR) repeat protein
MLSSDKAELFTVSARKRKKEYIVLALSLEVKYTRSHLSFGVFKHHPSQRNLSSILFCTLTKFEFSFFALLMTQVATIAEQHKQKGNECFDRKNFEEALHHYTEAIKLDPNNHIYYSNRSSCYYHLKNYEHALKDAYKSFELCPSWSKVNL